MPHVVAFIPARGGSKGLPNKNLRTLRGSTLVGRAINAAKSVSSITDIWVSTDSDAIRQEALVHGALCPTLRNPDLARDNSTTEATLRDALSSWEAYSGEKADLCVYFSPSEGYLNPGCVSRGIQHMLASDTDSYFSGVYTTKNFWEESPIGLVRTHSWMSKYGSRQTRRGLIREDTGRGLVSRPSLWRENRRIGDKCEIEIDKDPRANLDIHTELDLAIAELVLGELGDHPG